MYSVLMYVLITGWHKLKTNEKDSTNPFHVSISVIIAARNEEENIAKLLHLIANQTYSKKLFELIVVDDASEDNTSVIIQSFCQKYENFKSVSFKNHKGKKTAIDFAVKNAQGKLIVQTDADCIPQNTWLENIVKAYKEEQAQMLIAPVLMNYTNVFEALQALDFLSLMASGMGTAGFGKPIMNNAANLIFEKQAYLKLHNPNFKEILSGDDTFLLLNFKKNNNKIAVLKSLSATVYTFPEKTFKNFILQRKRWASKSKYYRDKDIIFTALTVFFINLYLLFSLIAALFNLKVLFIFAFLFLFKSLLDFVFMFSVTHFFKQPALLKYFLPVQIFNMFFIPYITFSSLFSSGKWK